MKGGVWGEGRAGNCACKGERAKWRRGEKGHFTGTRGINFSGQLEDWEIEVAVAVGTGRWQWQWELGQGGVSRDGEGRAGAGRGEQGRKGVSRGGEGWSL